MTKASSAFPPRCILHFPARTQNNLDLDGGLDLAEDVVSGGFILENGEMSINDLPGLGLTSN